MNKSNIITTKPTNIVYTPQSRGIAHQDLNYFKDVTNKVQSQITNLNVNKSHPWQVSVITRAGDPWSAGTEPCIMIHGGIWKRNNIECLIRDDQNMYTSMAAASGDRQACNLNFDAGILPNGYSTTEFVDVDIYATLGVGDILPTIKAPSTMFDAASASTIFTEPEWVYITVEPVQGNTLNPDWAGSFNAMDQLSYVNQRKIATVRIKFVESTSIEIISIKQHINENIADNFSWNDQTKNKPWQIVHYNPATRKIWINNDIIHVNSLGMDEYDYQYEYITKPSEQITEFAYPNEKNVYILLEKTGSGNNVTYDLDIQSLPGADPDEDDLFTDDAVKLIYKFKNEGTYNFPYSVSLIDNTNAIYVQDKLEVDEISLDLVPTTGTYYDLPGGNMTLSPSSELAGKAQDYFWHDPYSKEVATATSDDFVMLRLAANASKRYISFDSLSSQIVSLVPPPTSDCDGVRECIDCSYLESLDCWPTLSGENHYSLLDIEAGNCGDHHYWQYGDNAPYGNATYVRCGPNEGANSGPGRNRFGPNSGLGNQDGEPSVDVHNRRLKTLTYTTVDWKDCLLKWGYEMIDWKNRKFRKESTNLSWWEIEDDTSLRSGSSNFNQYALLVQGGILSHDEIAATRLTAVLSGNNVGFEVIDPAGSYTNSWGVDDISFHCEDTINITSNVDDITIDSGNHLSILSDNNIYITPANGIYMYGTRRVTPTSFSSLTSSDDVLVLEPPA